MPSLKSEAIILRTSPLGEADKLVSFFTRTHGRLRGVAPAARKSRKRFGAALEPLTYVNVWFFEKENRELLRLDQCEVIESYWAQSADYERTVALSHIAEVCEALLPEREEHERNFRLTLLVLRSLRDGVPQEFALTYFQLWSARLAGWLTELDRCSQCTKALPAEAPCYFSPSEGRLYCSSCRRAGTRSLHPAARVLGLRMLNRALDEMEIPTNQEAPRRELQNAVLDLIEHHADRRLLTREMLYASN